MKRLTKMRFANASIGSQLWDAAVFGGKWIRLISILHCFKEYVFDFSTTVGASMMPVFGKAGDVLVFDRLTHRILGLQRGEVVVAVSPYNPDTRVCKRIIGVPGDKVKIGQEDKVMEVPRGHLWLQGDNKDASLDSRHYGPVSLGLILGKVRLRKNRNR